MSIIQLVIFRSADHYGATSFRILSYTMEPVYYLSVLSLVHVLFMAFEAQPVSLYAAGHKTSLQSQVPAPGCCKNLACPLGYIVDRLIILVLCNIAYEKCAYIPCIIIMLL